MANVFNNIKKKKKIQQLTISIFFSEIIQIFSKLKYKRKRWRKRDNSKIYWRNIQIYRKLKWLICIFYMFNSIKLKTKKIKILKTI